MPQASSISYVTGLYRTLSQYVGAVKNLLCALLGHSGIMVLLCNNKSEVIREVTEGGGLVTNSRVSLGYSFVMGLVCSKMDGKIAHVFLFL